MKRKKEKRKEEKGCKEKRKEEKRCKEKSKEGTRGELIKKWNEREGRGVKAME